MSPDIIIIGAGIVGLSSAYELAGRGAKVSVLERGKAGMEASWAGGGILFPLLPWDYPEEVTSLALMGASLYPDLAEALRRSSGIDPEYVRCGMTVLPGKRPMGNAASWCESHDVSHFEKENGEFVLPDVAQLRNPRLIRSMRSSLESLGVTIREGCEALSLEKKGGRIIGLNTNKGFHSAGNYVACAGAWSRKLLGDDSPDIFPVKGQMLLFESSGLLDTILFRDGIYIIPRKDGHILAGSTLENAGFDKTVTAERFLHEAAAEMLPELESLSPVKKWAGLRPGSPGNIPFICKHHQFDNLYINSGHFRYGVTMAPASAKLLASLIHDETPMLSTQAYSCQR